MGSLYPIHTQVSQCSCLAHNHSGRMCKNGTSCVKFKDAVSHSLVLLPFGSWAHKDCDTGQSAAPRLASFYWGTCSHRNTYLVSLPTLPTWSQDLGSLHPSADIPYSLISSGALTDLVNLSLFHSAIHRLLTFSHRCSLTPWTSSLFCFDTTATQVPQTQNVQIFPISWFFFLTQRSSLLLLP